MNIKGIDVSVWQGKIDWKKVKASGIVFAMIRVGYGSSQGNDCKMDTYFKANVEGALAAGVEVGIYFYSYAKSAQAAVKEAAWVVEQIAPYKGRILYPIAYDLEDSKQAGLGRDVLTAMVTAFCTTIEAAGYYASFYCNTNWCKNMLNMDDLKGFDLWLAQWADDGLQLRHVAAQQLWQHCRHQRARRSGHRVQGLCGHYQARRAERAQGGCTARKGAGEAHTARGNA